MSPRLWLSLLLLGAAASLLPAQPSRLSLPAADARRVSDLLRQMTLDEKIGQMTQPDQKFLKDPADVEGLFVGSLLSGGDSDPPTNSRADWRAMYERWQGRSLRTRLKIPLLYGVDAVHGHSNVLGQSSSPTTSASAPRAMRNWSRRSVGSPRRKSARRASTGRSRPASRSRGTSGGDERTKGSRRIRCWWPNSAPRPSAACRPAACRIPEASSPVPNTSPATAGRPGYGNAFQ